MDEIKITRRIDRKTVLEKIFDGTYDPTDCTDIPTPQFVMVSKKAEDEHRFFEQFIPDEFKDRYEDLVFYFIEEACLENYAYFKEGLRVGLELKKELLEP